MTDIKFAGPKDVEVLTERVRFTAEEKRFFDDIIARRDARFEKHDMGGKARFYIEELESLGDRFGDRVAVVRRLLYAFGHACEHMATYGMEGADPGARHDMFLEAALAYDAADEVVGFYTDYALRQTESLFGANKFGEEAGLESSLLRSYAERGAYLLKGVFGGAIEPIPVIQGPVPDSVKMSSKKLVDEVVSLYALPLTTENTHEA